MSSVCLKPRLRAELGPFVEREDDVMCILGQRLAEGGIQEPTEFAKVVLSQCGAYSAENRCWTVLDGAFAAEPPLYPIFGRIFAEIRAHLPSRGRLFQGEMKAAYDRYMFHDLSPGKDVETDLKSSPDFITLAHVDHRDSDRELNLAYRHARQVLDIKVDSNISCEEDGLQLAVYCRQIFIEQPTRRFVLSFIFTQTRLRVYGFDRSGCWHSQPINFHEHPLVLIYATAFLLLTHDNAIGLDQHSVYEAGRWSLTLPAGCHIIDDSGKSSESSEPLVAQSGAIPLLRRHTIRGRGTTCWHFVIGDKQGLLKVYWRAVGRPSEAAALVKARGIKGVGRLLAYCEDIEKVSDLRGPANFGAGETLTTDRTRCQLVLEPYEGPLTMAPTPRALLVAFRDAVQGHRNLLFDYHILHRDISVHNIMFDSAGGEGNAGRLIDLDLAADVGELWCKGRRTEANGTRAYRSYKILCHANDPDPLPLGPHDHMDDLESFFYALCHISVMVEGPSTPDIPHLDKHTMLADWELTDRNAAVTKLLILQQPYLHLICTEYFAGFEGLLDDLRRFFWPRITNVEAVVVPTRAPERPVMPSLEWSMEERLEHAEEDYDRFIGIVSDFIKRYELGATGSASPSGATASVAVTVGGANKRPRSSEANVSIRGEDSLRKKTKS
ncbi:hypothetical protein BOTBODRAFT_144749 [Botryobasidium botryosum FD-172 SS1]|uniref:Fungal-type protein kinase domain-containing protein n=1 Tax=Botryobasidium botryosum (strain FD-172 SS1) TaxID=930990 RepID=A0A067MVU0_BOTB1|nr:hypothetical protein BOTBODRAFT_144749 [Botryobasidium botryosum FD-172 SS1]